MERLEIDQKHYILGRKVVITNITQTRVIYRCCTMGKKYSCINALFLIRAFGKEEASGQE